MVGSVDEMQCCGSQTLRDCLRSATDRAHAHLDETMSALDLSSPDDYAHFLAIQLAAREPIELWCSGNCPPELTPPLQSPLIRADLAELGRSSPPTVGSITALASDLDPLAVAWVVAGSSLGNRAMLGAMTKAGASALPRHFLSDPAMLSFWKTLKPSLELPASAQPPVRMIESAKAVFAVFQHHADRQLQRVAA